jgi:hypothetical protein
MQDHSPVGVLSVKSAVDVKLNQVATLYDGRLPQPASPPAAAMMNSTPWIFDIGMRRMKASKLPGWAPQMFVFSLFAAAIVAAFELGVPVSWTLTLVGVVDALLTQHFLRGALRRMRRLGWFRPTRARWWIELAALDWTLCLSLSLFGLTLGKGAAGLPAWAQNVMGFSFVFVKGLCVAFFALTMLAFAIGLLQGRRTRGRSLELVNFFFWVFGFIVASMLLVPQAPVLANVVSPVLLIVSILTFCAAGALAFRQRMLQTDK